MTGKYLFWDLETHNAGRQYEMTPREFVRTMQYAWDGGPVSIITDYDEMVKLVRSAPYNVTHNGLSYDLPVLFGADSLEPLQMALDHRCIDTFAMAALVTPAPYSYTDASGHTFYDASKPEAAKKWLSLANLCYQFNLPGKLGDMKSLAKPYQPAKTRVADYDYGLIPLDDPDFLAYAEQDVVAVRGLFRHLLGVMQDIEYSGEYMWREMIVTALNARISCNGVLVDQKEAQARVDELLEARNKTMDWLVEEFDFPTAGKQPWKSNAGKDAILRALESFGITPATTPNWTPTASGAPSFSGEIMIAITEGTDAEELGRALASLQGLRSLAQLALDSTYPDGRIHPDITCLQRSGRTSVQKPGLTVWTARGPGAVEKRYFIADPGTYMVEFDYSAADARAVAAVSGDEAYAERFAPGADAHEITGRIFYGDKYDEDPAYYRTRTKPGTHGMSYRIGSKKLAATLGVTVAEAAGFLQAYRDAYPWVALWQDRVTAEGENGYVTNTWGRRMPVDANRSFTQSSALIGQSSTREILFDGLIRIAVDDIEKTRWIRMTVHDAVVFCLPAGDIEKHVAYVEEKMSMVFDPGTPVSQPIPFVMSHGPINATNWYSASHE